MSRLLFEKKILCEEKGTFVCFWSFVEKISDGSSKLASLDRRNFPKKYVCRQDKKFFLNVFLIWAGTHQTFDEIKFAGAEVVGLQISNSKIRPEEWKWRIFFSLKSKYFSSYRFWNFGKKMSIFQKKDSSRWEKNLWGYENCKSTSRGKFLTKFTFLGRENIQVKLFWHWENTHRTFGQTNIGRALKLYSTCGEKKVAEV